jgi:hypothetical protein
MSSTEAGLLIAVASLFVTVLAIIADEVRDRRFRQAKSPRWTAWRTRHWSLFDLGDRSYQQPETALVECPTVTRLAFWNAGFVTIRFSDISPTDPFRIASHARAPILAVKLVRHNSRGSQLRVSDSLEDDWAISFDYLRPGAGGLFSVVHAGEGEREIRVAGELIDGNELKRTPFPHYSWHAITPGFIRLVIGDRWAHRLFVLQEVIISYLAIYLFLYEENTVPEFTDQSIFLWIAVMIQTILQTILALIFLRGWRVSVPESLRPFDQSDAP